MGAYYREIVQGSHVRMWQVHVAVHVGAHGGAAHEHRVEDKVAQAQLEARLALVLVLVLLLNAFLRPGGVVGAGLRIYIDGAVMFSYHSYGGN